MCIPEIHYADNSCYLLAGTWKVASEWSLVLAACRIPHRISPGSGQYDIEVDLTDCALAVEQIRAYQHENQDWPPEQTSRAGTGSAAETVWTAALLTALMSCAFDPDFAAASKCGAARAGMIMHGEWWLAVTALTLHADPAHLLGNMLAGGFVMVHAANFMGSAMAWFLALCSGIAGNMLNAAMQPADHVSIGSSTAIFGLIGAVSAYRTVRKPWRGVKVALTPLGAGLALLGFMGSSGGNADLGAHLWGFLSGLALGGIAGMLVKARGGPSAATGFLLASAAFLIPVAAWYAAWMHCQP